MLIDSENKDMLINQLNLNFRTILSYGVDDALMPNGVFIVKDIQEGIRFMLIH